MSKNILKTMAVGLACLTLCGTSLAAPGVSNNRTIRKEPARQQASAHRGERPARAPTRHGNHRVAQAKPAPRPAPAPRHSAPSPSPGRHHDRRHSETSNWLTFGAAVLGGIVGGLIGASN